VAGNDRDVVDRLEIIEREMERSLVPGHQVVDGPLDLLLDGAIDGFAVGRVHRHQDLPERSPGMLRLLAPERLLQGRLLQDTRLDQELAQALSPRRPGVDDAALVEPDARLRLATIQRERARTAAQMDELQRVGDGDVLDVAREAHAPTACAPARRGFPESSACDRYSNRPAQRTAPRRHAPRSDRAGRGPRP